MISIYDEQPSRESPGQFSVMKGAATIDDVARQAGVAISTVSHVVNGTRFVSETTRIAVEQAIIATGYIPNSLGSLAGPFKNQHHRHRPFRHFQSLFHGAGVRACRRVHPAQMDDASRRTRKKILTRKKNQSANYTNTESMVLSSPRAATKIADLLPISSRTACPPYWSID